VDLWDLTRLIIRRWYFAVPVLLVTLGAVLFASQSVKPDYKAVGHLQLIPPAHAPEPETAKNSRVHNPWLDLGIQALGQAAVLKVQDAKVISSLGAAGYSENVVVSIDYPATFFSIEVVGSSPEQTTGTVKQVMKLLSDDVRTNQQQYGVSQEDMITTLALDQGDKVTVVTSKLKRVIIVGAGISVLITAGLTIGVDALLRRRARRRNAAGAASEAPGQMRGRASRSDVDREDTQATTVLPAQRVDGTSKGRSSASAGTTTPEVAARVGRAPARPGKANRGRREPAQASDGQSGNVFRSKSADRGAADGSAGFDLPQVGGGGAEAGDSGRDLIVVQYQHDANERQPAGTAESAKDQGQDKSKETTTEDGADSLPIPSDATIVLPLSHGDWATVRDSGSQRR
jgi:hypothetical protein